MTMLIFELIALIFIGAVEVAILFINRHR